MRRFCSCFLISLLPVFSVNPQNTTCLNAIPFCTQLQYEYPATVNVSYSESGHQYGCLLYTKNPAWYYLQIESGGNIELKLNARPSADIDFVCWGPYTSLEDACNAGLTSNHVVDCSNSIAHIEYCMIPATISGEYYILMVTNYSNQNVRIMLAQHSGMGKTDCAIVNYTKLEVPNAFRPASISGNNVFKAIGENIVLYHMIIYDRWGRSVFSSHSINFGWDGTMNGKPAPAGPYLYTIFYEGNDLHGTIGKQKTGIVMLMR